MTRLSLIAIPVLLWAAAGCAPKRVSFPLKAEGESGVSGTALIEQVSGEDGRQVMASFEVENPKGLTVRGYLYQGRCSRRGELAQEASVFPKTGVTAPTKLAPDLAFSDLTGGTHALAIRQENADGAVLSCGDVP
jgi:hypothetical protein